MIEVLIIHYNTPELTTAAIKSLWKHTPGARVTVFDNSDSCPFAPDRLNGLNGQVEVIDNTRGQVVNWNSWLAQFPNKRNTTANHWASDKHCYSVELCMDRFKDGFILADSDVLFKKDVSTLCNPSVPWVGDIQTFTDQRVARIIPWVCWINTPLLKRYNIRFFNPNKAWKLTNRPADNYYDVGSWLLEACNNAGLHGQRIIHTDYIEHFGSASWRHRRDPIEWLEENRDLWQQSTKMKYTVLSYIFNGYEKLHEIREKDPDADYIMVTDDPNLKSDTWRIVLDERKDMGVIEKCYDVRFNPFRYAETELCVRLDSSVEIFKPLHPIIEKMKQGKYDRCLMLHPRRYTLIEEYDRWVKARNYPQEQAKRCLQAVRDMGYPLNYRGLFQCTFEVVRNNAVNAELNRRTLQMLHNMRTDTDIERIDQTLFSAIANQFFADRLKVLPVTQSLIQGELMQWHFHNTDRLHKPQNQVPTMMFNRPCKVWHPAPAPSLCIYVCTHTDFKPVVSSPVYEVVDARQFNGDICENGLHGSFYSELITYKYIAERKDLPKYVGFCSYRKYFSFMDNVPDMEVLFKEYDAVAAPCHMKPSVKDWYARFHNISDLNIVKDIIRKDYPELLPAYVASMETSHFYRCNMFIVRREDFLWLIKTVFAILDKYLEIVGTDIEGRIAANPQAYHIGEEDYLTPNYQYRIGGFLGERIVNALLRHRFPSIMQYKMVVTQEPITMKH